MDIRASTTVSNLVHTLHYAIKHGERLRGKCVAARKIRGEEETARRIKGRCAAMSSRNRRGGEEVMVGRK
ncbi:unnamed protein product [Prunus armeniaca]